MMPRVLESPPGAVPILAWAREVPPGAEKQLRHIASQPYVVEHVAAMPDVHMAQGVAVGTVFATERTVVPGALGGDLGCGVSAHRFSFPAASLGRADLERLLGSIARRVPVGDAVHRGAGLPLPPGLQAASLSTHRLQKEWERLAPRHLATLGGGNHFLELDRDGGGDLWLLIHSGSRGVGGHRRAPPAGGGREGRGLTVEEAPEAYRDIAEVLEDEAELVTPVLRLTPIAVLKG